MCMIDGAEDAAKVQKSYDVKASRKEHKCNECRRVIAKGEGYHRCEMVMEGSWYTFHVCNHCMVACRWLQSQCGGYLFEGVQEDIDEHAPLYKIPGLYRLKIGIGRGWKRFDKTGLMPIPALPRIVEESRAH